MRKIIALVLAGALSLAVVSPATANTNIDGFTNAYRVRHGLPQLKTTDRLHFLASQRARQIVDAFQHDFAWMSKLKRDNLCGVGENIAWRRPKAGWPAKWAFEAWRDSPSHRENMLGGWSHQASAIYFAPDGGMYAVQIFVLRRSDC